jgi:hypothetical protein
MARPSAAPPPEEWKMGKPDLVVKMAEPYAIPAVAPRGVEYQYFEIYQNQGEERWVESVEVRPGNYAAVHHADVHYLAPGMPEPVDDIAVWGRYEPGVFGGVTYPPGVALRLAKGSKLRLEVHYTVDGVARTDQTSVAIRFAKTPPKREVANFSLGSLKIVLAPNSEETVVSRYTMKGNGKIYSLQPHMHLRGKDFRYDAILPNGETKTLLNVPNYDFAWEHVYQPVEPFDLPKGTIIRCTAHFDNTAKQPNNPDPSKRVIWGLQVWDEMMFGYIDIAYDEPITSSKLTAYKKLDQKDWASDNNFKSTEEGLQFLKFLETEKQLPEGTMNDKLRQFAEWEKVKP